MGAPLTLGTTVNPDGTTTINQINPDPATHIAGAFIVPNATPVESDWVGVLAGGIAILMLVYLLEDK